MFNGPAGQVPVQKKTISPLILKHNYVPHHHYTKTQPDDLEVKYVDLNAFSGEDKENVYAQPNMLMKASMANFAFQTPNPHHQ